MGAVLLLLQEARAAVPCSGMPPSKLLIFDIKVPNPQIVVLPAKGLIASRKMISCRAMRSC